MHKWNWKVVRILPFRNCNGIIPLLALASDISGRAILLASLHVFPKDRCILCCGSSRHLSLILFNFSQDCEPHYQNKSWDWQVGWSFSTCKWVQVWQLPDSLECFSCVTGPLRAVAVLLLVGLTWVLASSIFGGDSGSTVRNFFTGMRAHYCLTVMIRLIDLILAWINLNLNHLFIFFQVWAKNQHLVSERASITTL